jgi:hypothetical protein
VPAAENLLPLLDLKGWSVVAVDQRRKSLGQDDEASWQHTDVEVEERG